MKVAFEENDHSPMNEPFQRHRQIGNQFFDVGSYERAAQEYESALALEPDNNFVRLKLARCWLHLNRLDKARRETEIALQTEPNSPDAHYVHSYSTRKWKLALSSIETALALAPDMDAYHGHRAYVLARLGRFDGALESARRALELNPESPANHRQMADILFDKSYAANPFSGAGRLTRAQYEQVVSHVERALELDPENARSHALEARLKTFDLDFEASVEKWGEALRLNPTDQFAQTQFRKAHNVTQMQRKLEHLWRYVFRWMPWPLRLPLTWGLLAASFWWGIICQRGEGFLSGEPLVFFLTFLPCALMTPLLLRDWLRFVPDRFLSAALRPLKKPPLR